MCATWARGWVVVVATVMMVIRGVSLGAAAWFEGALRSTTRCLLLVVDLQVSSKFDCFWAISCQLIVRVGVRCVILMVCLASKKVLFSNLFAL